MKANAELKVKQVPLNQILVWPCVEEHYKLLSDKTFLLKEAERISLAGIEMLLKMHPILVVTRDKTEFCVSGLRVLNIATLVMRPLTPVPVYILSGISDDEATDLALADLFLTPLVFSLAGAETIDIIRQPIGKHATKWTDLASCPRKQLAKAFGMSSSSLYYYDRKKCKSEK